MVSRKTTDLVKPKQKSSSRKAKKGADKLVRTHRWNIRRFIDRPMNYWLLIGAIIFIIVIPLILLVDSAFVILSMFFSIFLSIFS